MDYLSCVHGRGGENRTHDNGVKVRCLYRLATPLKGVMFPVRIPSVADHMIPGSCPI